MKDTDAINLYKNMRETLGIDFCPGHIKTYFTLFRMPQCKVQGSNQGVSQCQAILLIRREMLHVVLVYLTHLDYQDTEVHMTEKLQAQVDGTEWSWKNLNTVSFIHLKVCIYPTAQNVFKLTVCFSCVGPLDLSAEQCMRRMKKDFWSQLSR
jgi:hypothetical protein